MIRLLVVRTVNAAYKTTTQYVLVYQRIQEVLLDVDRSVRLTQTAILRKRVGTGNVWTRVQTLVDRTLNVGLFPIVRFVHVVLGSLAILSVDVIQYHVRL